MITNYGQERAVGEVWIDSISGAKVITVAGEGCKGFRAFDINEGRQVGNLIYASLMENTEDSRQKLQKLADLNKEYHLVLQLRRKDRVCFQTK